MAPESKTFLAATVLNDGQIVSYRSLSRELKVHSNVAKKMLYEFHQIQNSKKPRSVYATYLLDGVPQNFVESSVNGHQQDEEDMHMQSSPYLSSSMPQESDERDAVPSRRITLAREEDLEAAKARFERIHSIHIYSLEPSSVQNLQVLSECNRAISAKHIGEDPLVVGKKYGVIHNNGVMRKTGKRPVTQAPVAPTAKSKVRPSTKPRETPRPTECSKTSDLPSSSGRPSTSTPQAETKPTDKKPPTKPVSLKREESNIFRSFSKPKAKLNREDTGSSAGASPAPAPIDIQSQTNSNPADGGGNPRIYEALPLTLIEPMQDASEEEDEDRLIRMNKSQTEPIKSRSEREEQLRKMMDEDEEMRDTVEQHAQPSQESELVDAPNSQKASSPEPTIATTGGRRRGRRKVTKKKTIKDEEGYLVTKEEPAWESFSEDETAPHKERTPASTASSTKSRRASGKPGQGNIMSFFGKK